ncbi:DeoR/GlpR family DNA-binding transcription regulator [Sporohalobacter salinus]|uniref:DeoR/GlpR family DNA-binding transcription regulator n=1 Tax=Sporohalobacter salinus TaxID=1494606 RepID=UPI00196197D8|nr:DeoR/GlpR family DNA-binding transcription regulator [Sporohalobacter salinus]MBM7623376.1 DeoR/GlpR family transcriptional regulator of sugar metabolism [Sporohalobacter salinus]
MLSSARQDKILNILKEKKQVTTQELKKLLNVTGTTIRKDFKKLEKEGFLKRVHGGAVLPRSSNEPQEKADYLDFHYRSEKNIKEKKIIGQEAAKLIKERQSIFLDASSTILYFLSFLKEKNLTIITNGLYTALKTKEFKNCNVILLGGIVRSNSGAIEGLLGKEMLTKTNADIMFTSAHGFTLQDGLTDFNFYEAQLKEKMLSKSKKLVALLDHTKIGQVSATQFASIEEIDVLITDDKTPEKKIKEIRNAGIEVKVAK